MVNREEKQIFSYWLVIAASAIFIAYSCERVHGQKPVASLTGNIITADACKLAEITVEVEEDTESQTTNLRWLVLDTKVDWRQYEGGTKFVATAPSGEYQARLTITTINWEARSFNEEERVYTISIRGPPNVIVNPNDPVTPGPDLPVNPNDPVVPGNLTGPVYVLVARYAADVEAEDTETLLEFRVWSDEKENVVHLEFPPDSENAAVKAWVNSLPANAPLPYVFIARKSTSGGSAILWQGKLPSFSDLVSQVEKVAK